MNTLNYKTLKEKETEELRELGEEREIEDAGSMDRGKLITAILEHESENLDAASAALETTPNVEIEDSPKAGKDSLKNAPSPASGSKKQDESDDSGNSGSKSGGSSSARDDSSGNGKRSRSGGTKDSSEKQSSSKRSSGSKRSSKDRDQQQKKSGGSGKSGQSKRDGESRSGSDNGSGSGQQDGSQSGSGKSGSKSKVRTKGDDFGEDESEDGAAPTDGSQEPEEDAGSKYDRDLDEDQEQGILDYPENGSYGFMRQKEFGFGRKEIYVSMSLIKKFNLRTGDLLIGKIRPPKGDEHFHSLIHIDTVFDTPVTELGDRPHFHDLPPIHPRDRLILETDPDEISTRMIDLFSPIGKGQRGIIVSKPKAGKTTMLKKIANGTTENHPEVHLIALLIDERPEEVTDFERSVEGEVFSSTFDEEPENHIRTAEITLEYAKRKVERGEDVMILLDSLTRLARAYNLTCQPSGKTLSGGLDPNSVQPPKTFLGAARNIENGGSLTIICTALIETGSRLDDIIYEEFKGTANMELHLSRELADKRIFPALDPVMSGTRQEELIYRENEMDLIWSMRKMLSNMSDTERMNKLVNRLSSTDSNAELLLMIKNAMNS